MNGYSNRETFLTVLWLDNYPDTQDLMSKKAKELTLEELAEYIKEYVIDNSPLSHEDNGYYNDLLYSAFEVINWVEVARAFLEE